jgi:hypothetical protein
LAQSKRKIQDKRLFFDDSPRDPHAKRIRTRRKYRCQADDFSRFLPRQSVCLLLQWLRGTVRLSDAMGLSPGSRVTAGKSAQLIEKSRLADNIMGRDDRESLVRNL